MEKIVFVTGDKSNPAAHHIKKTGSVTVGRSYTCDIILSDTHIEAIQLIFHFVGGVRTVEVLDSTNPVLCNGAIIQPGRYPFASGDEWALGKTRISVFNENHLVEPAEKIFLQEFTGGIAMQLSAVITGILTLAGWTGFQGWLDSYQPVELGKNIAETLISSGYVWFVVLWSCVMALVCRFKSGRSQFGALLIAGTLFAIINTCFDTTFTYATYGLNLGSGWKILYYTGATLLLTAFMLVCFSLIMNLRGMKYMALGLAVCWFGFDYLDDVADQEPLQPSFNQTVKPSFALLIKPQSVENFIQQNQTAFSDSVKDD